MIKQFEDFKHIQSLKIVWESDEIDNLIPLNTEQKKNLRSLKCTEVKDLDVFFGGTTMSDLFNYENLEELCLNVRDYNPFIMNDFSQLQNLRKFILKDLSNNSNGLKFKSDDMNIVFFGKDPSNFKFVLEYPSFTFKFSDL